MKVKEENKKAGLKLNVQKTKIMAFSPITLWQMDGETMGTVTDFIFLGSKINEDGDYSIIWLTKVHLVKDMVFPVVMYRYESWAIQKAELEELKPPNCGFGEDSWESLEQQGIKPINLKWNQPWLFIGRTDTEAPILWPPDKSQDIGKIMMLGKINGRAEGDNRGWDVRASSRRWRIGKTGMLQSTGSQRVGHTEQLNWTCEVIHLRRK